MADRRSYRSWRRPGSSGCTGYAKVLAEVVWRTQSMGPPSMVAGQTAFQTARRLRVVGLKGSAAPLADARPADDGGRPLGGDSLSR
eukprot:15458511-Alexandrium_andersonii.AAC.1